MSRKLTSKQKAAIADCSCSLPNGMVRKRLSKKAVIIPFVIFGVILYVFWALWPPSLLWLLGTYIVVVAGNCIYRLLRGHTLVCALAWSPVAALYAIADALMTAPL